MFHSEGRPSLGHSGSPSLLSSPLPLTHSLSVLPFYLFECLLVFIPCLFLLSFTVLDLRVCVCVCVVGMTFCRGRRVLIPTRDDKLARKGGGGDGEGGDGGGGGGDGYGYWWTDRQTG